MLSSNDLLGGKILHLLDISNISDDSNAIEIPETYNDIVIDIKSYDDALTVKEERDENNKRLLKFSMELPESEKNRAIRVKVSIKDKGDEYCRNLIVLAYRGASQTTMSTAISSVYSETMGKGTRCYGSIGNTTSAIIDYDMLTDEDVISDYIVAARPVNSAYMFDKGSQSYTEIMDEWSYDIGCGFKHTFGSWSQGAVGTLLTFTSDKNRSVSGEYSFGMSSSMDMSLSYEYYFNYYLVQCQNINIDLTSFSSSTNSNLSTVDTYFLSMIDTEFINEFTATTLDCDAFIDTWGTDIISSGLYGGAYTYFYGREENAYENSVSYDASASLSYKTNTTGAIAGAEWLSIFAAMNSDYVSVDADASYMSSEYQTASNTLEFSVSNGGNYQDDPDAWIAGFSEGDYEDLSVLISYRRTNDSSDDEFCNYSIDLLCGDIYNSIVMLLDDGVELSGYDDDVLSMLKTRVEDISTARELDITENLEENTQKTKPRLILADFMMKAYDDQKHNEGPGSFVAEDPNRLGKYLIYYPIIANQYAPENSGDETLRGHAIDTALGVYFDATTDKSHYWYYALGREGTAYPITDILFCETPSDDSMRERGDSADEGIAKLRDNKVWVKYGSVASKDTDGNVTENKSAITAVALLADDNDDIDNIIGSSGGAEINDNPSNEKEDTFKDFWGNSSYTKFYTDDEYKFYEKGGVIYHHHVYVGYSKEDLPVDFMDETTVYQAKEW